MNRAHRFRREVAGDSTRRGELPEEPFAAATVTPDAAIELARFLRDGSAPHPRASIARTDDIDHSVIIRLDDPVERHMDEVEIRRRPQSPSHRGDAGIRAGSLNVDLADRQIIGRPTWASMICKSSGDTTDEMTIFRRLDVLRARFRWRTCRRTVIGPGHHSARSMTDRHRIFHIGWVPRAAKGRRIQPVAAITQVNLQP